MVDNINQSLSSYEGIDLSDLSPNLLMNRYDSKFLTHIENVPGILDALKEEYQLLRIDQRSVSKYTSLYFDTSDLDLYHDHHNQRKNRYKFRYRQYEDTGDIYFEIKHKNNKNYTTKIRIPCSEIQTNLNEEIADFINENSPYNFQNLSKVLKVTYDRITLIRKNQEDRITIDSGLVFFNDEESINFDKLVILEVKAKSPKINRKLMQIFNQMNFKKRRVSKYCVGVINLIDGVKYNLYKEKLNQINKIEAAC